MKRYNIISTISIISNLGGLNLTFWTLVSNDLRLSSNSYGQIDQYSCFYILGGLKPIFPIFGVFACFFYTALPWQGRKLANYIEPVDLCVYILSWIGGEVVHMEIWLLFLGTTDCICRDFWKQRTRCGSFSLSSVLFRKKVFLVAYKNTCTRKLHWHVNLTPSLIMIYLPHINV